MPSGTGIRKFALNLGMNPLSMLPRPSIVQVKAAKVQFEQEAWLSSATPSAASSSRKGVTPGPPYRAMWSIRNVSMDTIKMFRGAVPLNTTAGVGGGVVSSVSVGRTGVPVSVIGVESSVSWVSSVWSVGGFRSGVGVHATRQHASAIRFMQPS